MEAAGVPIVPIGEFGAGMQRGQDHFGTRLLQFGMRVHGHSPTVILDFQRAVLVQGDDQPFGMAGQNFVDAVVDNFLREMVRCGGVGVHAGALAHRL